MSGRAGWALASTIVLLVAMAGFNLLLIPRFGAIGAALGTLASFTGVNTLHSIVIWRHDRFAAVHAEPLAVIAGVVGLLLAAAFGAIGAVRPPSGSRPSASSRPAMGGPSHATSFWRRNYLG